MTDKKKKIIGNVIAWCVVLGIFTFFAVTYYVSCYLPYKLDIQEDGHFQFLEHEDSIQITGLTKSGIQQEVLVIPPYIWNKPVTVIGYGSGPYNSPVQIEAGILKSEVTKKVYFPWTFESMYGPNMEHLAQYTFEMPNVEEVVYLTKKLQWSGSKTAHLIYLQEYIDSLYEDTLNKLDIIPPNLIYHYNYLDSPNTDYYWIDYITGSNRYVNPESPIREGYTFGGWYLDEDCTIEWDGTMPANETEKTELYAGWQEK